MAVNTAITKQQGALAFEPRLKVMCREIDIGAVSGGLASGAHFEVFGMPTGAVVVTGSVEVLTVDAGGGTLTLGIGGTGTELRSAVTLSAKTIVGFTNTAPVVLSADTIDMAAASATVTTAKVRIWVVYLDAASMA